MPRERGRKCPHGMPTISSCLDCMYEIGLGDLADSSPQSVYSRCLALVRSGVSDTEVAEKMQPSLDDDDLSHLVDVGLAVYAAQARRQVAGEAWRRGENPKQSAAMKRYYKHRECGPDCVVTPGAECHIKDQYWKSKAWREQHVAMGHGIRTTRGQMTVDDLNTKVDQLSRQREGLEDTITDYAEQREFLITNKVRNLDEFFQEVDADV